jgi:hypothetical protein
MSCFPRAVVVFLARLPVSDRPGRRVQPSSARARYAPKSAIPTGVLRTRDTDTHCSLARRRHYWNSNAVRFSDAIELDVARRRTRGYQIAALVFNTMPYRLHYGLEKTSVNPKYPNPRVRKQHSGDSCESPTVVLHLLWVPSKRGPTREVLAQRIIRQPCTISF